jgi:hypothetical protein
MGAKMILVTMTATKSPPKSKPWPNLMAYVAPEQPQDFMAIRERD